MNSVYHQGEQEVQRRAGEELAANSHGRIITNTIIKGAVNFLEKQPMVIVSSTDSHGQVWTSLLIGDFGFVQVPTPHALLLETSMIHSTTDDVFYQNMQVNPAVGLLFIELTTRRRFRINGFSSAAHSHIKVDIQEAYANCPKYIQRRVISFPEHFKKETSIATQGSQLGSAEQNWIKSADTLFVGSRSKGGSMDASHRGGPPGFVELLDNRTLKIPDYQGNSMFNTLGNIVQCPQVGILFIDFNKRQTLQLTGSAALLFEQQSEEDLQKTTGTGRYWLFHTRQWIRTENHHSVAWEFLDYSPFNP